MVIEIEIEILVVKVFVIAFQNSKSRAEQALVVSHIRSVKNPVGILLEKLINESGDGRGLGEPGGNISKQIRVMIEQLAKPSQVVVKVGQMTSNENGLRMLMGCPLQALNNVSRHIPICIIEGA